MKERGVFVRGLTIVQSRRCDGVGGAAFAGNGTPINSPLCE